MKNCIEIIENIRNNKAENTTLGSFTFYQDQRIFKSNDLQSSLMKLFLAKLSVPQFGTGSRYSELKEDPRVYFELLNIKKLMGLDEKSLVTELLYKKWGIRYDYSNLSKK